MLRVVGSDPGTSSLDLLLLGDGAVIDQVRLEPAQLREDPEVADRSAGALVADRPGRRALGIRSAAGPGRGLHRGPPRADVAGPARRAGPRLGGHRVPVVGPGVRRVRVRRWSSCPAGFTCRRSRPTARRGPSTSGRRTRSPSRRWRSGSTRPRRATSPTRRSPWSRSARPSRRSWSSTGDRSSTPRPARAGPLGLRSGGAWDGEVAYWRGPLAKDDLFRGGLADLARSGRPPIASRSTSMPPPCRP